MQIKNVFLSVSDVAAATNFYQAALGMTLQFRDGQRWAQFKVGGVTFALSSPDEAVLPAGSNAVITLQIEDIETARAELLGRGVKVDAEIRDMGAHGRTLGFSDPDGNRLQLYQAP